MLYIWVPFPGTIHRSHTKWSKDRPAYITDKCSQAAHESLNNRLQILNSYCRNMNITPLQIQLSSTPLSIASNRSYSSPAQYRYLILQPVRSKGCPGLLELWQRFSSTQRLSVYYSSISPWRAMQGFNAWLNWSLGSRTDDWTVEAFTPKTTVIAARSHATSNPFYSTRILAANGGHEYPH